MVHTPGPWTVKERVVGSGYDVHSSADSRAIQRWQKNNPKKNHEYFRGVTVAELGVHFNGGGSGFGPHALIGLDELEANATLISAAPDLLAACKRVAPACDGLMGEALDHGVTDWGAVNEMICSIRAAIAKAERGK